MNTHNKIRFDCDICGESYKTNKGLDTHMKSKHSEDRSDSSKKSFICNVCKKAYVTKMALQRHMTSAHKSKCENL